MTEIIIVLPYIGEILLSPSDLIEIFGIITSLLVSLIAIIVSVLSLRQNSKMIEESTRPQIQIYPVFMDSILYLIIKNYGSSEAYIDEIKCSHAFTPEETMGDNLGKDIFSKLSGAILSSGYAVKCPLIGCNVKDEVFDFQIKYHSSTKKYRSSFSFNPIANVPFADLYPSGNSAEDYLRNTAKELHNIVKMNL